MSDGESTFVCFIYPNAAESGDPEGGISWTASDYGGGSGGINGNLIARAGYADGFGISYEMPESGTEAMRSLDVYQLVHLLQQVKALLKDFIVLKLQMHLVVVMNPQNVMEFLVVLELVEMNVLLHVVQLRYVLEIHVFVMLQMNVMKLIVELVFVVEHVQILVIVILKYVLEIHVFVMLQMNVMKLNVELVFVVESVPILVIVILKYVLEILVFVMYQENVIMLNVELDFVVENVQTLVILLYHVIDKYVLIHLMEIHNVLI